jgi:hypothetical protein
MLQQVIFIALLGLCFGKHYPVPIPEGGRFDVHGWLVLPIEQPKPTDPSVPIEVWLSHHVPEFWTDSPHDFQIMIRGQIVPTPSVLDDIYVIDIPYPPANDLVVYEWSITPPSPFSLNDLLSGKITTLNGVFYNGSFDTSYERQPMTLGKMTVLDLTTAVYLNETEPEGYPDLQYLSYPRGSSSSNHFYLAHQIHQQPDFDHVVHAVLDNCSLLDLVPLAGGAAPSDADADADADASRSLKTAVPALSLLTHVPGMLTAVIVSMRKTAH